MGIIFAYTKGGFRFPQFQKNEDWKRSAAAFRCITSIFSSLFNLTIAYLVVAIRSEFSRVINWCFSVDEIVDVA